VTNVPLRALLWDFDGLILDTETGAYESARAVFDEHGVELELGWWHSIIGTADHVDWFDVLEAQVGHPLDRAEIRARRNVHKLELLSLEPVRPGVQALLTEAEGAGVRSAVASSSPHEWVAGNLERVGLLDRFAAVVTRDHVDGDGRRTKPAPDLYLLAAAGVGAEPASCVAIEDSPNGVAAAKAAGMACVAVPAGMTAGLDFGLADLTVPSLAALTLDDVSRLLWAVGSSGRS
jgi:HAD superfamily hydrolase (TIGR01509 family)